MANLKLRKYCLLTIRWVARIYGSLLAMLILTIAIGEGFFYPGGGLPNPLTQPLSVAIELFAMLAILLGCIVGWKWYGLAGLLVIGGMMVFHVIEGKLWLNWTFGLFDLAGILFLLCWWSGRAKRNGEIKDA